MLSIRPEIVALKPYIPGKLEPGKIKLASNENPLGPSPRAVEAIKVHLSTSHLYPDDNAPNLIRVLARQYRMNEDWFIAGNGSDEILQLAAATFIHNGDEVLVADHTFSVYSAVSILFGATMKKVPLVNGSFKLADFVKAVTPQTRVIFLCSPNNPTGTIIKSQELEQFLSTVSPHILVILDEAYAEFVDDPDYPDSKQLVRRYSNLLITRTFSKLYGLAGLRLGYGIAQPDLISNLQRTRPPFNVNSFAQAAGTAALEDRDFIHHSLQVIHAGRALLQNAFSEMSLEYIPTQANFICIETHRDAKAMYDAISEGGVTIRPMASFGMPSCIRVTIGTESQNKIFLAALENALAKVPVLQ